MPDVLTLAGPNDTSYRMHDPGPGRVGSKVRNGEPYERKLLHDVLRLDLAGTAFDVGAHVGNHTLWLAAVCGLKVHAWEPQDASRASLVANLDLNPGLDVTVHDWAAGARPGRGRITGAMTIRLDRGHIPVHRIDDLVHVDDLAVVKIDVEGMEPHVLAGMTGHLAECRPVVYTECHTRTAHRSVAEVIEPLGYKVTKTIRMGSVMERWQA